MSFQLINSIKKANLHAKIESSESLVSNLQMQLKEATENLHLQNNVAMMTTDDLATKQQQYQQQQNSENSTSKLQDAKIQRIKQKVRIYLKLLNFF